MKCLFKSLSLFCRAKIKKWSLSCSYQMGAVCFLFLFLRKVLLCWQRRPPNVGARSFCLSLLHSLDYSLASLLSDICFIKTCIYSFNIGTVKATQSDMNTDLLGSSKAETLSGFSISASNIEPSLVPRTYSLSSWCLFCTHIWKSRLLWTRPGAPLIRLPRGALCSHFGCLL